MASPRLELENFSKGISEHPTNVPNLITSSPNPNNDEAEDHIDIEDIFCLSSPYDNTTEKNIMKVKKKKEKQMNNTTCLVLFYCQLCIYFLKFSIFYVFDTFYT